jgi:hypothetical protein
MIWRGKPAPVPLRSENDLTPQEVGALQSAGKDRETFLRRNGWWPKEEVGTGRINAALTKIVRGQALVWGEVSILQAAARDRECLRRRDHTWESEWDTTELIESGLRKLRNAFYERELEG